MRKIFKYQLLLLLLLASCSKTAYKEYRVYPVPGKLKASPGSSSFIVLKVEIPQNYHIYSNPKGPGIGKPTEVFVSGPKIFRFKPARYLKPEKYTSPDDDFTWVFYNETKIFIPFTVTGDAKPGENIIKIRYESLYCSDTTCIPGDFDLTYSITVSGDATVHSSENLKLYGSSTAPGSKTKQKKADPDKDKPITDKSSKTDIPGNSIKDITFKPQFLESSRVAGILGAIIFGLIAGFILNFMPCVLPVVSLKIMGFVQSAGKDRSEIRKLGFLFSMGILVSFALLATLAAYFGYNWGDLFQYSSFLIVLTAIVFALSLSMFGLFTISPPSIAGRATGKIEISHTDAFTKGLLATLLATPCSGPFLGGTLAWALSQPPFTIFIIFMSVGIGMASPYLVLSMNPTYIKYIPKPGEWTHTFEHVMGFFLLFTVVYLINILESSLLMPMITFLSIVALGFWQYGRFGSLDKSRIKRYLSVSILIVLIVSGYLFSFKYLYEEDSSPLIISKTYSVEKLIENRKKRKISIVKFTADWCPNCKVVEKLSLYTEKVAASMRKNNAELLTADITKKNPPARELLLKLQSRSIPFLAVMPGGDGFTNPVCLRDIYSEDDVLKAIELARKRTSNSAIIPELKIQ